MTNPLIANDPASLRTLALPRTLRLLVLAPHPDDFDAVGVTARFLWQHGHPLHVAVATSGASGVEDAFCSPPTREVKAALREEEQRASCHLFGLPEDHLAFLRLKEDGDGHPLQDEANGRRVRQVLVNWRPAVVFLPHWRDTNPGHRRIYAMFRQAVQEAGYPIAALLNRDPKTIHIRCDLYTEFDEEEAAWKGDLLRCHRSQHQRNLEQRGHGIDERILRVNRESAGVCSVQAPYAEVFEVEFIGVDNWDDLLRRDPAA